MPHATNDGVRIYYEVEGDGPPLLLHVGFMGRLQDWRRKGVAAPQALADAYRVILLDPRGQGRSDKPHDPVAYSLDRFVADVVAVLDTEGIDRAHFWGYSMGGRIGLATAIRAPQRLRSIIAGGTATATPDATETLRVAEALRSTTMAEYVAHWEATVGPLPDETREGWLANDPLALAAIREAGTTLPDLTPALPAITLPALIYAGDQDAPHGAAERAAASIPGATFLSLPGLNHALAWRRADLLLPPVRAFLAQAEESQGAAP